MHITFTIPVTENVTVVCNQTNKLHSVKAYKLSLEDGDIKENDFVRGKQLMLEDKNNHYPVTFLSIDESKKKQVKKARLVSDSEEENCASPTQVN